MNSDTILDYAQFQLSPRRTRCELFVSGGGKTEKLASGFLKPFLTHLKVAEEQANQAVQSIKLEVEKQNNAGTWFNKGTLERFVRFVSTPEVLELVNTYDAEMSQLEGARKIYSQGAGDKLSGENESAAAAAADITKKELLRAMDVRLTAVKQDLATACARASAAGFTLDTVSELLLFADRFGALRLNEACAKFISLCQRRPELISHQRSPPPLLPSQWKGFDDANIRSSSSSDMSIDEPEAEVAVPFRRSISGTSGTGSETLKLTSAQPIEKSAADIQPSVRPIMEKDTSKAKGGPSPTVAPSDEPIQPHVAGSRRLSVQDRINLFESKQKEQSGSASISSSGSGGGGINKTVTGKAEHRRLPSDVSMEKSVLRRWSGASDMSIDLTNNSFCSDKECGSAAGTPTSSAHSQVQSESKIEEGAGLLKDTTTSWPKFGPKDNSSTMCSSSLSSSQTQIRSFPKDRDGVDDVLLKEITTTTYKTQSGPSTEKAHGDSQTQFGTSMGGPHQGGFSDETATLSSSKPASESGEGAKLKDHTASLTHFNEAEMQNVGMKDQTASQIPSRAVPGTLVKAEPKDQAGADTVGRKSQAPSTTKFRTFAGKTEDDGAKPKDQLDYQFQSKASLGKEEISPHSDLPSQSQWKISSRNQETGSEEEAIASHMSFKASEDSSGSQRLQLHGRTSSSDQMKKLQGRRDERLASQGTSIPVFSVKKAKERDHVLQLPSTPPVEQAQVVRPLKGNSELNDELQMKADELEKLFAAHKLRVHGDQTASSRRSKTIEGQVLKSAEKRPVEVPADQFSEGSLPSEVLSNGVEFNSNLLLKMVDDLDSANSMKQKFGSISPSDDSRGKLYERYMQKRDAKLREEWGSKRAQKEAKMKAMHDSLERSQEEMKAKLAGSSDKRDSVFARRRAEKMRSFNLGSDIKYQGQIVDPSPGEGEDLQELDQVLYGQDRSYSDTLSGNESSTSSKRLVLSKSLSSSTPRTSAGPIPKPSAKATANSSSIRRRTQPENPLAQSVPNFSDLRKENTKPVTGVSKVTSRTQPRTFARSKSAAEEANLVKDEKSRRSHSMRKNLAIPGELRDLSPLSSDGANLTSLKFPKEQMEQCINKIQKIGELKPFLRKGNGIGPGTGAGLSKLTASTNCEALIDDEDSEGLMNQREGSPDMVKDYEEEFDKTSAEGNLQTPDFPVESDGDKGDPGSENGDVVRSLSQDVDDSIDVSSKFNLSSGNVLESPGESPGSWNSNIHHTFSYAHEASDDVSVDSPTGSPASWNSHPLNQLMEADAARMRKKWGSAQIPVLVANAPHQPRKDVTKGFKRLLKFGRKSKGADYLVNDWVSASTASEGDDDTEDGRERGSRNSDELRKSRMGYSVAAYDGFNDGDNFPEQAPRSFFSLSSFRSSKGSEAKPR